jgi:hypothetical protein
MRRQITVEDAFAGLLFEKQRQFMRETGVGKRDIPV